MKELLEIMARSLVDDPESVTVTEEQKEDLLVLKLHVAKEDMGKVIGKSGRIARALRQVLNAAASREKIKVAVDIDD